MSKLFNAAHYMGPTELETLRRQYRNQLADVYAALRPAMAPLEEAIAKADAALAPLMEKVAKADATAAKLLGPAATNDEITAKAKEVADLVALRVKRDALQAELGRNKGLLAAVTAPHREKIDALTEAIDEIELRLANPPSCSVKGCNAQPVKVMFDRPYCIDHDHYVPAELRR